MALTPAERARRYRERHGKKSVQVDDATAELIRILRARESIASDREVINLAIALLWAARLPGADTKV